MSNLQNNDIKCRVCGGAGYIFDFHDGQLTAISHECTACDGTGLSFYGRTIESTDKLMEDVFTCKNCGAKKVHYRLYGYCCPHHCKDES